VKARPDSSRIRDPRDRRLEARQSPIPVPSRRRSTHGCSWACGRSWPGSSGASQAKTCVQPIDPDEWEAAVLAPCRVSHLARGPRWPDLLGLGAI
jgi:hypothetical protein